MTTVSTDLLVIGKGPAGISASLYAVRGGLSVLVVSRDAGLLWKDAAVGNYFGFPGPVSGRQLLEDSWANTARLGVSFLDAEATGIAPETDGSFLVSTTAGPVRCLALVIATGQARKAPRIEGLDALTGRGVAFCTLCDAYFHRGKPVAVLGDGAFALHEARELAAIASSVTLLANGRTPSEAYLDEARSRGWPVDLRPIRRLEGQDTLTGVSFDSGDSLPLSGLFIAEGMAGSLSFAVSLGLETEGGALKVDRRGATAQPGIFGAGDCVGGILQLSVAVGEGAAAGISALEYVRRAKKAHGHPD